MIQRDDRSADLSMGLPELLTRAAASAVCLERMGQQFVTQGLPGELASLDEEASLALAELEALCTETIR